MSFFSLAAKFTLDGSHFKAGIREAQQLAKEFGRETMGELKGMIAGAFGVYAIERFIHSTIEAATRVKHLSEQFDVTTDQMQEIDNAAKKVGLTFEDWGTALMKIGRARKEASSNLETRAIFQKAGMDFEFISRTNVKNDEVLKRLLEHSRGLSATSRERADIDLLAGKRAEKLLAVMEHMGEKDFSMFKKEDIHAIDKAEIALKRFQVTLQTGILPALAQLAEMTKNRLFPSETSKEIREELIGIEKYFQANPGKNTKEGPERMKAVVNALKNLDEKAQTDAMAGLRAYIEKNYPNIPKGYFAKGKQKEEMFSGGTQALGKVFSDLAKINKLKTDVNGKGDHEPDIAWNKSAKTLMESMYQLELKRLYGMNQRAILQREINDLVRAETFARTEGNEIIAMDLQAKINQKKTQLLGMESLPTMTADALQKKGVLTGGTLSRAAFWGSAGASPLELQRQQLTVSKQQLKEMQSMGAKMGKSFIFFGH